MENINQLRKRIDKVDEQILRLLSERAKMCESIGSVKKEHGMSIKDAYRESEVFTHVRQKAVEFALDPVQVESVYRQIINMCNSIQKLKEKGQC
jgi:chorismate mutase/prephenate dehydratase